MYDKLFHNMLIYMSGVVHNYIASVALSNVIDIMLSILAGSWTSIFGYLR